jgi:chaperonin GroEL
MGNPKCKFAAIKQPGFGNMQLQMFDDVAIMTGGTVVSEHRGHAWPKVNHTFLGRADKIIITQHKTSIIGAGCKDEKVLAATTERIEEIRALIENAATEFEADKLKKLRLAKLTNGVGIIHVGGQTEVEMREKMDRIDDAKCATYAAIAEGVVPGGGVAYLKCIQPVWLLEGSNKDEDAGIEIIKTALYEPIKQILINAGNGADEIITKLIESPEGNDYGYNAKSDQYENFFVTGIIDPCKVARVAIENAASVGAMFLTTAAGIVDVQVK